MESKRAKQEEAEISMFTLFLLISSSPFSRPLEAIYKNVLTVSYGIESESKKKTQFTTWFFLLI
jgi:hypothetical protein